MSGAWAFMGRGVPGSRGQDGPVGCRRPRLVVAFFGTWVLCQVVVPSLETDVMLSLAGLTTAVVSLPLGVWAGRDRLFVAAAVPARGVQVVVGEIPQRPPAFQQCADLRARLLDAKGVAVVTAVTGSRGIGKTHLAAAVARGCVEQGWPLVAWIVAEDAAQTLAGMERLAWALGLTAREDDALTAARKVRAYLETRTGARSLVVFDNVPDSATVRPWLPAVGSTRVTSRVPTRLASIWTLRCPSTPSPPPKRRTSSPSGPGSPTKRERLRSPRRSVACRWRRRGGRIATVYFGWRRVGGVVEVDGV